MFLITVVGHKFDTHKTIEYRLSFLNSININTKTISNKEINVMMVHFETVDTK